MSDLSISQTLQQISGLLPGVGSDLGKAGNSISNLIPSGWGLGVSLLLLLPFVGALIRPFTRLGISALNALSAIMSALIFCISSWMVALIEYITLLGRAIRPSPRAMPIIGAILIVSVVAVLFTTLSLYAFNSPPKDIASCLVHGEIKDSCLSKLNAKAF
jgi:hypothetical protein